MTIDEAIRHAEEVAEEKEKEGKLLCQSESASVGCLTCAEEHRQLAEWLRDYKRLKEQEPSKDAISRKALISHIENQSREWGEDYDAQQILGDIEDMPSVKPQEPKWIPVSERLPKKGKQVLCCNKNGSVFTSAITYKNSNGMVAFGQHYEVIAWMPLPEPYKGE